MFYTKEVKLFELMATEDDWGAVVEESYQYIKCLMVDVQPNSREKLNREYGYDLETTKRMYTDKDDAIKESVLVTYEEEPYHIVNIVEWDDYYDIALVDAVGVDWDV